MSIYYTPLFFASVEMSTETMFSILAAILFLTLLIGAYFSGEHEIPLKGRRLFWGLLGFTAVSFLTIRAIQLDQFGDVLSTLASFLVALVAVWHDEVVNFVNPARAILTGPLEDPNVQYPQLKFSQALHCTHGFTQYHFEVRNLNRSRPLRNARVVFNDYKVDDIARQFTWAPHESEPKYAHVESYKVLDFCYHSKYDSTLCLILYSGKGKYEMGERLFNFMKASKVEIHLMLQADNLADQHYLLQADLSRTEAIFRLKKFEFDDC